MGIFSFIQGNLVDDSVSKIRMAGLIDEREVLISTSIMMKRNVVASSISTKYMLPENLIGPYCCPDFVIALNGATLYLILAPLRGKIFKKSTIEQSDIDERIVIPKESVTSIVLKKVVGVPQLQITLVTGEGVFINLPHGQDAAVQEVIKSLKPQ